MREYVCTLGQAAMPLFSIFFVNMNCSSILDWMSSIGSDVARKIKEEKNARAL